MVTDRLSLSRFIDLPHVTGLNVSDETPVSNAFKPYESRRSLDQVRLNTIAVISYLDMASNAKYLWPSLQC